jgi:hypothetical protein
MSPEEYRQHSCGRKVPFTSRKEARQRASTVSRNFGGGRVMPYRCQFDDHWHLGHDRSKKERRATRG